MQNKHSVLLRTNFWLESDVIKIHCILSGAGIASTTLWTVNAGY